MKKGTLLIMSLGCLLLAGCSAKTAQVVDNTEDLSRQGLQSMGSLFSGDSSTYPAAKVVIKTGTGIIIEGLNGGDSEEKKYKRVDKIGQDGPYREAIITGYLYVYTYNDLGIKITTPPLYEPYFSKLTQEPLFKRYYNIIYNAKDPDIDTDFIAVYTKDPKVSLQEEIMKNHLPEGCDSVESMILGKLEANMPGMVGFQSVFTESSDYNNDTCKMDKQFPNRIMPVSFVMDPKHPEKYYKIGMSDGCAPGPCSIFGNIEFF